MPVHEMPQVTTMAVKNTPKGLEYGTDLGGILYKWAEYGHTHEGNVNKG